MKEIFADKEIIFRSQGKIHFIRIGARLQAGTAAVALTAAAGWLATMGGIAWHQASLASDQAAIDARAQTVAAEARKVNAYKASVNEIADDLRKRQDMLDDIVRSQFGGGSDGPDVVGREEGDSKAPVRNPDGKDGKPAISASLQQLEARQTRFARQLTELVNQRAQKAESAIRSFGLNPSQLAARYTKNARNGAQGGPYIPWKQGPWKQEDDALTDLSSALTRLNILEQSLIAIPSGRPTASPMLTSSYGYRRDPFNGHAAFHAGVDFPGSHGQPILSAAAGRVSYVGQKQGYGNVVEIDHGNGLMTRYAHLSRFTTRTGEKVARGAAIARMGSTGRSTGTHLHFEVRLNDTPINPRRFFEVKDDVLKAQQNAKQRFVLLSASDDVKTGGRN